MDQRLIHLPSSPDGPTLRTDMAIPFRYLSLLMIGSCLCFSGCAEGPLWRLGYLNPWVVKRWNDEEQFLASLSDRRERIERINERASRMSLAEADQAVDFLWDTVLNEPILLVRLEATAALGRVPSPRAADALVGFLNDPDVEIRQAATESLGSRPAVESVSSLARVLQNESEIDVRLAAARELAKFRNNRDAIAALGGALSASEPALQFRAMESLESLTGKNFGYDARKWQAYLNGEAVEEPRNSFAEAFREIF